MFKNFLLISFVFSLMLNMAYSKDLQGRSTHQIHYVEMDDKINLEVIDGGEKIKLWCF